MEAGEEGAGGGIPKRGGSREKWEKFRNIGTIFQNRKSTRRREPLWKGRGTGSAGCGRRDVQTPCPPPPPQGPLQILQKKYMVVYSVASIRLRVLELKFWKKIKS